ncbi:hypothetical protein L484_005319 [Morus notabilis]|uniref:Uncharacterized protein n=1 Tax=Morus notabilis TaxID=981085 RepID=W9RJI9_9ROSA|nr:hypothetical protein L484_005319 [Morus notabilis]
MQKSNPSMTHSPQHDVRVRGLSPSMHGSRYRYSEGERRDSYHVSRLGVGVGSPFVKRHTFGWRIQTM